MAKDSGYSQRVVADILNSYHNLLADCVKNGNRIEDFGFITIESVYVPEHMRYDPRDNKTQVVVKPKFKVKTSVGKTLRDLAKEAINNVNIEELND
jgi:nucleoid DNA-binding protein